MGGEDIPDKAELFGHKRQHHILIFESLYTKRSAPSFPFHNVDIFDVKRNCGRTVIRLCQIRATSKLLNNIKYRS